MRYENIIFDMDGLLIDSMMHWIHQDDAFFAPRGIPLTPDMIRYFTGKSLKENMTWAKEKFGLKETVEELVQERVDQTDAIYTTLAQPLSGVTALLSTLHAGGGRQAIASGSPLNRIQNIVDRFAWNTFFEQLISVDHVDHKGKPAPDVYLYTAKKLGVDPASCVVFEDAENGVLAAKAAGMACIAVPDPRWSYGDFSAADLSVTSLDDAAVYEFLGYRV